MAKNRPIVRIKTAVAKRSNGLYVEVRELILHAREQTAQAVNSALTMTYWHVGNRVRHEILKNKRADYGQEIVSALARQLESEFGRGYSEKSLRHMIRFAEAFPNLQIVSSLLRQLSWTHFLAIIYQKDPLQREFYAEMCRVERWSTRTLQERIQSMLYERTAISKKAEKLIAHELQSLRDEDKLTPDLVFRDPYVLDFHERQPGEDAPVALILCAGAKKETAEYLDLGGKGIHVAEYLTQLPPPPLLAKRLHTAVRRARERLASARLSLPIHERRGVKHTRT